MKGIVHPFTKALYEQDGAGRIRVSQGDRWGLFTRQGVWLEGDLRECDPQLCGWVGGPQIANHRLSTTPSAASS